LIAGVLIFLLLVALILAFTFLGSSKQTRVAPIRDGKVIAVTSCGPVEGVVEDSAVTFRGIPYAKPPIGDLRFEHAQVIDDIQYCWNGTFIAHNFTAPECLQRLVNGSIVGSEDWYDLQSYLCDDLFTIFFFNSLNLDVITPEVRYINLLPVIVMIGTNDFAGNSPGNNINQYS
jgi:carboxylesterase type B